MPFSNYNNRNHVSTSERGERPMPSRTVVQPKTKILSILDRAR